jgi:hypothetical protein
MSQDANSTPPRLPTARKSHRTSQRNRPVLISSRAQGTQEFQGSQVETLEPEIMKGSDPTELLAEATVATETPAKARRVPRLPGFFSKVEKTVEEPEISQEAVVKARLARAKKTTPKAGVTPVAHEKKERDGKPADGANRTAATTRPKPLFKTRHLVGMGLYLIAAESILPLEKGLLEQYKLEQTLGKIPFLNIPVTTALFLNLGTLLVLLLILVRLDLLPTSLAGRRAATARAQQQRREQGAGVEKQPQPTMRQGVKGEDDDLYQAYRSNQRREKKH